MSLFLIHNLQGGWTFFLHHLTGRYTVFVCKSRHTIGWIALIQIFFFFCFININFFFFWFINIEFLGSCNPLLSIFMFSALQVYLPSTSPHIFAFGRVSCNTLFANPQPLIISCFFGLTHVVDLISEIFFTAASYRCCYGSKQVDTQCIFVGAKSYVLGKEASRLLAS